VLTSSEADAAAREYRQRGWFEQMIKQVKQIGGVLRSLESRPAINHLLNVRYRPETLEIFEPYRSADAYLARLPARYRVYQPVLRDDKARLQHRLRTRRANSISNQSLLPQVRKGTGTVIANPIEKIMQKEICEYLKERYGSEKVEAERDFVDIKVQRPEGIALIELKASASALRAIRTALGQVLEYAFFHPEWRSHPLELVIVGQGPFNDESRKCIEWLRKEYHLPVRYIKYELGSKVFEL
jgi:hypothetical protein